MGTCQIVGQIYHSDNTPWRFATLLFYSGRISFDSIRQYPKDVVKCATDAQGFVKDLKLITPQEYTCVLPGNSVFNFTLDANQTAASISELLNDANLLEPVTDTIKDYIDSKLALNTNSRTYETFESNLSNVYQLLNISQLPAFSAVYFNGHKQLYSIDYLIDSSVLTILKPLPVPYTIEAYY